MAAHLDPTTQAYVDAAIEGLFSRLQTPPNQPKVKEPDVFDGNKARYDAWKQQVQLYVGSMAKDRAITTMLSFIRGERVERWRQAFSKKHHHGGAWSFATTDAFWTELDKIFVDPNLAKTAQARLERCVMGNRTANEFFQEFEELVDLAEFKTTDMHVVDILQRNARESIVNTIYASGNEPTDYEVWKTRISNIDTLWCKSTIIRGTTSASNPFLTARRPQIVSQPAPIPRSTAPPPPAVVVTPHAPTRHDRHDGTGVTYGGRGQPMDLDRACIKCGKKKSEVGPCQSPWHIPNRSPQQQKIRRAWEDETAREEFLEDIRLYAAEDPEDFAAQGFEFGST
ncbi:hypothetical protein C8Q79DRAFT_914916 [Trametes meyenii]|nr:hypothetical protein C8Q79DRAFT_914916 [Trametes meyenii]